MYALLCGLVLAIATCMACHDIKHHRYKTLWEASAGVLLVAGLAMVGYGLKAIF